LVPAIEIPAVHHIPSPGASTAKEKGSTGPVQERCDSGTFSESPVYYATPSMAQKKNETVEAMKIV